MKIVLSALPRYAARENSARTLWPSKLVLRGSGTRGGSAGDVRVELDLDRHAGTLVAAGLRLASAAVASDPNLHPVSVLEVAPPAFAVGPPDADDHSVAFLAVTDWECVAVPAPASRNGDQSQTAAQQRMQRRAEHRSHNGICGAVEYRERRMTLRHGRDGIAVGPQLWTSTQRQSSPRGLR